MHSEEGGAKSAELLVFRWTFLSLLFRCHSRSPEELFVSFVTAKGRSFRRGGGEQKINHGLKLI